MESRRKFLKQSALIGTGIALTPSLLEGKASTVASLTSRSMISIQMGPHSILDEGIEPVLDFLKKEAAMNAVMLYSHTYYGPGSRPARVLAHDHLKPLVHKEDRNLRMAWVNHNETYFKDTILRHKKVDSSFEYYNRDVFKEIHKPARDRGMNVFFRILELGAKNGVQYIENFDKVLTKDIDGQAGSGPCWNNPDYRNWVFATIEDVFRNYPVDGLQYGAERVGPLSAIWFKGEKPECFCNFCRSRNQSKGIDPDRALEGYTQLYSYMQKVEAGKDEKVDTVTINLWKYLQRYPEVLAWNYQWFQADEEIQKEIYLRVKKLNPDYIVGRHVDHQRSSWDFFYRSAVDYEQMAESADFVKPIVYHDVFGPRLRYWVIDAWKKRSFRDFSETNALEQFYDMMGYSPAARVSLDRLEVEGMGPAYVYDEILRCVKGVNGKSEVVAGIGIDVPWHGGGQQPFHSNPERLQQAIFKAVEAGATGILASREYDEIRYSSLRAFGNAIRQLK